MVDGCSDALVARGRCLEMDGVDWCCTMGNVCIFSLLDFGGDSGEDLRNFYNKIYYKLNNLNEIIESIDIFEKN